MYTPGGVAVAIRGVGGRWGSRCGRFRCGPTVLLPQRRVLLLLHDPLLLHCCTIHCCAIATSATITAVLHHQSRCDGRQTAIGMLSAVTLPDRPHCRCTALSGALTISGCHPRQDPPPSNPPPLRQKCKRTYPISRFSRASSSALIAPASRGVLSSVSTLSMNRPSVLPRSSSARTCVPSVSPSRSAICSSF
jgi:hypothetical protein